MKLYEVPIPQANGRLYQSANTLSLTHEQRQKVVAEYCLNVIVNLWSQADPDMKSVIGAPHYWHFGIPEDIPQRSLEKMVGSGLLDMVCLTLSAGRNVLVQCHEGKNRSGLLNALVYRHFAHCSGRQAMGYIRSCCPDALTKEQFILLLEGLPC